MASFVSGARTILLLWATTLAFVTPAWGEMVVHFVDVGQGGAIFIQKDGKNIVYDCGDTFAAETMIEYLEIHDVKTIDVLIPSHAHKDHMGACPAVMKKFEIGTVYHNDSDATTGSWKAFKKAAAAKAEQVVTVDRDITTDFFTILVAYANRDRFSKEADNSLLLLLEDGNVRVLLTGDCEASCEKAVMGRIPRITVLSVGHHGANAASSLSFLQAIRPTHAVISAGNGNQYGHPTKPVLARLKQVKATIYRTDHDGTIVVRSTGSGIKVETEK